MKVGKHGKEVPAHVRLCKEGTAYLCYFDQPTGINFEWTGNYSDPIEVSQGGDQVSNLITGPPMSAKTTLAEVFARSDLPMVDGFKAVCKAWLIHINAPRGSSREPMRVVEVDG